MEVVFSGEKKIDTCHHPVLLRGFAFAGLNSPSASACTLPPSHSQDLSTFLHVCNLLSQGSDPCPRHHQFAFCYRRFKRVLLVGLPFNWLHNGDGKPNRVPLWLKLGVLELRQRFLTKGLGKLRSVKGQSLPMSSKEY